MWDNDQHDVLKDDEDAMPSVPLMRVKRKAGPTARAENDEKVKETGQMKGGLRSRFLQKFELNQHGKKKVLETTDLGYDLYD